MPDKATIDRQEKYPIETSADGKVMSEDSPNNPIPDDVWVKLVWLLILLPGFVSLFVATAISNRTMGDEFAATFYSLLLSFIVVFLCLGFASLFPRLYPKGFNRLSFGVTSGVISVILGIGLGLVLQGDTFYKVLRQVPWTSSVNKRSDMRPLVFLLSQNTAGLLKQEGDARPNGQKQTEAWILITIEGGKQIEGWPEFYEISDNGSEIYLSPACEYSVVNNKKELQPIPGPGILVYERAIISVTFLDREQSLCFLHWLG